MTDENPDGLADESRHPMVVRARAARVIAEAIASTGVSDERLIGVAGRVLSALDGDGLRVVRVPACSTPENTATPTERYPSVTEEP